MIKLEMKIKKKNKISHLVLKNKTSKIKEQVIYWEEKINELKDITKETTGIKPGGGWVERMKEKNELNFRDL